MSERLYSADELADLLERAETAGLSLEANSPLENMTIEELEAILRWKQ